MKNSIPAEERCGLWSRPRRVLPASQAASSPLSRRSPSTRGPQRRQSEAPEKAAEGERRGDEHPAAEGVAARRRRAEQLPGGIEPADRRPVGAPHGEVGVDVDARKGDEREAVVLERVEGRLGDRGREVTTAEVRVATAATAAL